MQLSLVKSSLSARVCLTLLAAVIALGACSRSQDRVYFDGKYFRTKAKHTSDDRQSFFVKVPRIDQGLAAGREAGRYEGTLYCVENFGTSEIAWVNGPDADDADLNIDGNTLVLNGRCVLW